MTDPVGGLTAKVVEEAAHVLPEVYRDAVQPAAREIGSAVGRAVRMALAPVRGLAWTWERAEEWLERSVQQRFEDRQIAPADVTSPPPQLAAGVTRGVQAAGPEPEGALREMFANLLATAMQANSPVRAHPAFAEILAQLAPDEARLLRVLARRTPSPMVRAVEVIRADGFIAVHRETISSANVISDEVGMPEEPDSIQSSLDNLSRLGIIRLAPEAFYADELAPDPESDHSDTGEREQRWQLARSYLLQYGHPGTADAVKLFEEQLASYKRNPTQSGKLLIPGRRPGISLQLIWSTAFGSQLLRAVSEPQEFGSLAGIELEARNVGPGDDAQAT